MTRNGWRSRRSQGAWVWLSGTLLLCASLGYAATNGTNAATARDDAAITPAFAQELYDQLAPLRESDGCRVTRFDTSRSRNTVGLQAPAGAEQAFEIARAPGDAADTRTAGEWALAVPAELERDCGAT